MGAALSFKGVTKTYRRSHLGRDYYNRGIEDLSLDIAAGEAFGLLGLNGSGKTTTFKLALGLLKPTSGKVSAPPPREVGYLPELPYFYPYLSVSETLSFYAKLSGLLDPPIARVLDSYGLSALKDKRMSELSKGLLQRVGLAQAVLHEPDLLVLDEPVSGLDPLAIKDFRDGLQRLNEGGKTILLSSHSISEVEKLCHRVGILKDGRLARVLERREWEKPGLEALFVETVR